MKEIEYYKINETLSHKYYQIPKELCENSLYKSKLNSDSKLLYSFLLDRLTLSQKHNWYDEDKNIYLIFTREEVQEKLNLSDKTVTKAFKLLSDVNLVREKRQELGKPNLIYVGKIQYEEITDTENLRLLNHKNYDFGGENITTLDTENLRGINTNNINTDINYTNSINLNSKDGNSLNKIKEQCKLNEFTKQEISILEDVIDTLYYSDNLKVGACVITNSKIISKLELITKENLIQLLDMLKNIKGIQKVTNYLMICLYNNLGNAHLKEYNSRVSACENNRKYPDGFFDRLYANCLYENALITS